MTKNVVGRVLLPMVRSTQRAPRAFDTLPSKSLSIMSVLVRSSSLFPSFRSTVYGMILTAAPPSTINLVRGRPSTCPLRNNAFMCCRSSSSGLSNVAIIGSKANRAVCSSIADTSC
ncbi:hypothetical protein SEVIR_1G073450v4 [Setaria viridis]